MIQWLYFPATVAGFFSTAEIQDEVNRKLYFASFKARRAMRDPNPIRALGNDFSYQVNLSVPIKLLEEVSYSVTTIPNGYLIFSSGVDSTATAAGDAVCAASLVAPDLLLTAAHCQRAFANGAVLGSYILGSTEYLYESAHLKITNMAVHPDYNVTMSSTGVLLHQNDLMILKINPALTSFAPVSIEMKPKLPIKSNWTSLKYIRTRAANNLTSIQLLQEPEFALDTDSCQSVYGDFLDDIKIICVNSTSSCRAGQASAAPLLAGKDHVSQIGVSTHGGANCSTSVPLVFMRLSGFVLFLEETICKLSSSPPASFNCSHVLVRPGCNHNTCSDSAILPSRRSKHPTLRPTAYPTSTLYPTDGPSQLPSQSPTAQPSNQPSMLPTGLPSIPPSALPSAQPSLRPTNKPTKPPTAPPYLIFSTPCNDLQFEVQKCLASQLPISQATSCSYCMSSSLPYVPQPCSYLNAFTCQMPVTCECSVCSEVVSTWAKCYTGCSSNDCRTQAPAAKSCIVKQKRCRKDKDCCSGYCKGRRCAGRSRDSKRRRKKRRSKGKMRKTRP